MEHFQFVISETSRVRKSSLTAIALFFLPFFLGCEKPLTAPEHSDPIYLDLEVELKKAEAEAVEFEKTLEETRQSLAEAKPRDIMRKRLIRELYSKERYVAKLKQMLIYHKEHLARRREYVRAAYSRAYRAKEPWPDPREWQDYQTQKRLRTASRNWAERVPKLQLLEPTRGGKIEGKAEGKKAPEGEGKKAGH